MPEIEYTTTTQSTTGNRILNWDTVTTTDPAATYYINEDYFYRNTEVLEPHRTYATNYENNAFRFERLVRWNEFVSAMDKICKLIEERTAIKIETSEILELLKE